MIVELPKLENELRRDIWKQVLKENEDLKPNQIRRIKLKIKAFDEIIKNQSDGS